MSVLHKKRQEDFEELVRPHLDAMYRLAYRLTGSRERSEDLVQDLVIRIYTKQDELRVLQKPSAWLAKVLYNLFLDQCRRDQRSPITYVGDLGDDSTAQVISLDMFPGSTQALEQMTDQDQFMGRLEKALGELNEEQRVALMMYEVEGYSLSEIEEITDTPVGTLKSRLHRARNQLKSLLFNDGTEIDPVSCKGIGDKQ